MEKKQILNIMVDLETASIKENAAILSWAMVAFTTDGSECDVEPFYKAVDLTSCFISGMDIDCCDTQKWWMKQEPESIAVILQAEKENILPVTRAAYCWLSALAEKYDLYMWCRGIDFDLPKIEWCFRKFLEQNAPYKYYHKMDVRTVLEFMQIDQSAFPFEGVKHHSVDDCRHDIKMVQKAYQLKNDWMMAYVALSAKGTANYIESENTEEAKKNSKIIDTKNVNYKNLISIVPKPVCKLDNYLDNYNVIGFSLAQLTAIENHIQGLEEDNRKLKAINDDLDKQLEEYLPKD